MKRCSLKKPGFNGVFCSQIHAAFRAVIAEPSYLD